MTTSRSLRRGAVSLTGAFSLAAALAFAPLAAHADIDTREFKVVGTWGNLQNWKDHESRFWNDVLPKASGGNSSPGFNAVPSSVQPPPLSCQ